MGGFFGRMKLIRRLRLDWEANTSSPNRSQLGLNPTTTLGGDCAAPVGA